MSPIPPVYTTVIYEDPTEVFEDNDDGDVIDDFDLRRMDMFDDVLWEIECFYTLVSHCEQCGKAYVGEHVIRCSGCDTIHPEIEYKDSDNGYVICDDYDTDITL
jgi:hypothetical protein